MSSKTVGLILLVSVFVGQSPKDAAAASQAGESGFDYSRVLYTVMVAPGMRSPRSNAAKKCLTAIMDGYWTAYGKGFRPLSFVRHDAPPKELLGEAVKKKAGFALVVVIGDFRYVEHEQHRSDDDDEWNDDDDKDDNKDDEDKNKDDDDDDDERTLVKVSWAAQHQMRIRTMGKWRPLLKGSQKTRDSFVLGAGGPQLHLTTSNPTRIPFFEAVLPMKLVKVTKAGKGYNIRAKVTNKLPFPVTDVSPEVVFKGRDRSTRAWCLKSLTCDLARDVRILPGETKIISTALDATAAQVLEGLGTQWRAMKIRARAAKGENPKPNNDAQGNEGQDSDPFGPRKLGDS